MAANRICPAMPKKENPAGFSFRHDRRNAILNTYGSRIHRWISSRFQRCRGSPQTLFSSYSVDDTLLTATAGSICFAAERTLSRSRSAEMPANSSYYDHPCRAAWIFSFHIQNQLSDVLTRNSGCVTILARFAAGALQSRRCDTCNTT